MTYEAHPAARLFPMMDDSALRELADDIKANGQVEPIVIYQGQILDGRNRYAACQLADVEPRFERANGNIGSPVFYVLSKNLHRRHLTTSQRATIAAEMIPLLREEASKRQATSGPGVYGGKPLPAISSEGVSSGPLKGDVREIAASAVNVGSFSVQQAINVQKANPELFEKVKRGEITVNAAAAGHKEQPRRGNVERDKETVYLPDTERKRQVAEAQKRKMIDGLAMVGGVCHGLENLNVAMAIAVCDSEEVHTWAIKADNHARELKRFAVRLRGARGDGEPE